MLNKETFKDLFNALYPRLVSYSFKYVKDAFIAEEIVEDCLVVLWEKRKDLAHIDNVKPYLYTMVRNASFKYLEKKKRMISLDQTVHDSAVVIEQGIIEEEVHAVILYQALETLPPKCRKVFELSCLKGMKYKDIATDMDISLNTVKSQRSRAIELLKKQLKNNPFLLILLSSF
ncbi:hypothetical protein APS56_14595 [Pseudalgibacter alginicilyticus]|uniref:RNA polymerase subunit sigma-24 n=1 Tax=Pseudalgibacter alginicilyticus TaxID=1736674 RepID=A0A0P0DBJ2_9FLAO|nr:RNA polymerase sigma-70 factor [Pseudalgibacter alginicilyticus]ALJ06287.1 hypothetical protein APS56_14595 [Pseudalgibacter alginicilyticus]